MEFGIIASRCELNTDHHQLILGAVPRGCIYQNVVQTTVTGAAVLGTVQTTAHHRSANRSAPLSAGSRATAESESFSHIIHNPGIAAGQQTALLARSIQQPQATTQTPSQ